MAIIKYIIIALSILCITSVGFSATVYVSQSGGSVSCGGDGTQSTTAVASVSWSAGNTYKICGTISSTMTVGSSGSVGNPIDIAFESNGVFSAAAFNPAAIELNGKSYIIVDGGVACGSGTTCSSNLSGTGEIQNTANGTGLGNDIGTNAVDLGTSCGSNIEIKNLLILNVYVKNSTADEGVGASDSDGIFGTNCGSNILIHDNTSTFSHASIFVGLGSGANNVQIYNNVTRNATWGISGAQASGIGTNLLIYGNDIDVGNDWSDPSGTYHIDGIFVYGQSFSIYINGIYIYNNYMHGTWAIAGQCPTGYAYVNQNLQNFYFFNNTINVTGGNACNGSLATGYANASQYFYNNTFIGHGSGTATAIADAGTNNTASTTIKNNVVLNFDSNIGMTHSGASSIVAIDYNDYYGWNTSGVGPWNIGAEKDTFAAWQATTCGGSGCDAHGMVTNPNLAASYPFIPAVGSPLITAGGNLYSICNGQDVPGLGALCNDAAGIARPTVAAWDIGAYQYVAPPVGAPGAGGSVTFSWDVREWLDRLMAEMEIR